MLEITEFVAVVVIVKHCVCDWDRVLVVAVVIALHGVIVWLLSG